MKFVKINFNFSKNRSLLSESLELLSLLETESLLKIPKFKRFSEIKNQVNNTGTYWQTVDELSYGAKIAWRNSTRCIGRNYWQSLEVRDRRDLNNPHEIFDALVEHLELATNNGRIRPFMTVFRPQKPNHPGIRIWNEQLIRYAGYKQSDGFVIGDPKNIEFTKMVKQMGWKGAQGTPFDILPIVIQMPSQEPEMFELPPSVVLEVPIQHPEYPWFAELELKWHAVPLISNMMLDVGGIKYTAAPFNGWYMGTEIGSRNFGDKSRYNLLPIIAKKIHLNNFQNHRTLWIDRSLVELNIAVLYSFHQAGVTIVDHHTESYNFIKFEKKENSNQRTVYADWSWIVPPMSGSATPVFHRTYQNIELKPNFFYQPDPWLPYDSQYKSKSSCPFKFKL